MSIALRSKASRQAQPSRKSGRASSSHGSNLAAWRRQYGLSQMLAARLLDVSLRTVSALESPKPAASRPARNEVQARRLCGALAGVMQSSHVAKWLDSPNEMLGGLKPIEAIERGQVDLVWAVVEGLCAGAQL